MGCYRFQSPFEKGWIGGILYSPGINSGAFFYSSPHQRQAVDHGAASAFETADIDTRGKRTAGAVPGVPRHRVAARIRTGHLRPENRFSGQVEYTKFDASRPVEYERDDGGWIERVGIIRKQSEAARDCRFPFHRVHIWSGNPDVVEKELDAVQRMMFSHDGKPVRGLPVEEPPRIIPLIVIPRTRLHEILERYAQVVPFSIPCHDGGIQRGAHAPGVVLRIRCLRVLETDVYPRAGGSAADPQIQHKSPVRQDGQVAEWRKTERNGSILLETRDHQAGFPFMRELFGIKVILAAREPTALDQTVRDEIIVQRETRRIRLGRRFLLGGRRQSKYGGDHRVQVRFNASRRSFFENPVR